MQVIEQLTPWFDVALRPVRKGMYQAQDRSMNCNCCWFDAHWNGAEWHTDLLTPGRYQTVVFNLTQWRGRTCK